MAQKTWQDKFVKCPFYIHSTKNKIICEGFVENTALHQAFSSSTDRSRYMEGICYSLKGCEVCPIHQINSKLWEEKDE